MLDRVWELFDPLVTAERSFAWLAAWLALPIDPTMPLAQQRELLKGAFAAYLKRGTVAGLEGLIEAYTGIANVRVLEHFKLRNWAFLPLGSGLDEGTRLWSRELYARLQVGRHSQVGGFRLTNAPVPETEAYDWGANQFSVMFAADPYTVAETSAAVQAVVDREKPAHTESLLRPVFARLRVGVQATLGVDAYVGKANAMILGKLSTLSYDAVLARSERDREVQALGLSLYPRLNEDARIL
jgi:hypothetical protein